MKKTLLPKILVLFIFSYLNIGVKAQCPTCHDGAHWSVINDSTHHLPPNVAPNGNDVIGAAPSFLYQNVCGLNYITESFLTTTRESSNPGTGFPATFNLPPCMGAPLHAYMFWGVSYWEATPPTYTISMTNPVPSTATYAANNIGTGPSKCWGEVGTAAYEADVTASLGAGGAYSFTINGPSTSSDDKEIDGCTLVYIYNSGGAYSGSIALWDGDAISSTGSPMSQTLNGINVCAATATASGFTACGDEQANVAATHTDIINGNTATFNNNFWNTDIIPVTVTAAQTTCAFEPYSSDAGDCYSWILAGLYWQNTSCVVCTPTALTVTIPTFVNPTCGNNNGSATATVTGGTPPYTYLWTPSGQTTATAIGLSAGTYTVSVEDATGCTTVTATVTLTTSQLTVTANTTANEPCFGSAIGSASSTVTGGTAPYTYAWTPTGGTNSTANGLTAGTYTITATDKNGCTGTATVTITQPPAIVVTAAPTNILCNGGTGSSLATVTGGTAPYTYAWTPNGGTNATGTGLTVGSYTVNVTDANGCTGSATVTITQPPPLTATTTMTQANCGNANGTTTVTAGGGTPNYSYSWAPSGQTNATATGLTAGSYTVTVTDANSCTTTSVIVVTSSGGITVSMGGNTNDPCSNSTSATATVNVTGGTMPYTYAWTPNGGSNATGTGLSAGNYTVTVTDANGCNGTATVTITSPPALIATMGAPTDPLCNGGNNGSATVTATGGTAPYTYLWTPSGGTNATGTGLSAGVYTVFITDNNGCDTSATVVIGQPTAITITTTTLSANCNQSDGSATATPAGGTGPYTYLWAPSGGNAATATSLSAGTYTVTVTDNNGCTQTATAVVSNLNGATATMGPIINVACFGGATGSATVTVAGGTAPYTYAWAPSGGSNATANGLTAGSYTVTVTDANGCTSQAIAIISQPTQLLAVMGNPTNVLCFGGNNGSATVTVTGGSPPYTYAWTPAGGNTAIAAGLTAGTYTVNITDNNGCTTSATVTITQPAAALAANITATNNVSCSGGNNGSLAVTATGGTAPYTYAWTPSGGVNAIANNLTAGNYTVVVTDGNGCTATATGTVAQPNAIVVTTTSTQTSCQPTGTATATATGGTVPYTYKWTPSNQTNATATALSAGTYTITVTDNNGCTQTATATVTSLNAVTATMGAIVNVTCFGGANGTATVTAASGTAPYTYAWAPNGGTNATGTGLSAGTYTVTVTDNNGCTATASATIAEPAAIIVSASGTASVCSGQSANLNATATGGTLPYTYAWTPAGGNVSNPSVTPLVTTTYTILVTDANGCTGSSTVTVNVNPALALVVSGSTAVCPGHTATFTATGSGGDGNYTYTWSTGAHTQTISVTPDSTEVLTVTLNDGCGSTPLTLPVVVTVDPLPLVKFSTYDASGCFPFCVQFRDLTTISSGGINNWLWYFGTGDSSSAKAPIYCYSTPGQYNVTLTVVSDSGCSSTLTELNYITVWGHPSASFTYSPDPVTILTPEVQFTDNSTGPYGIMEWQWTFGDNTDSTSNIQNPEHTYQDTGTFCARLAVMDIHGCVDTTTNCIDMQPQFTFYIPDAFTPNGDGINDVFLPKGSYIKNYEMYIFDRWGMQLFHSTNILNGWDGTVHGNSTVCQEDTYVYLIKVTDAQGTDHNYTGKVNLVK